MNMDIDIDILQQIVWSELFILYYTKRKHYDILQIFIYTLLYTK